MHRFFSNSENISGNRIILTDKDQIHHIKDVLRLKRREKIKVFDEKGNEYNCLINDFLRNNIALDIKNRCLHPLKKKGIMLTVACAVPKKSKMDDIVDKLTQLGVDRIIPLLTQRLIVRLDKNKIASRQLRWRRVAQAASQQSRRNVLPIIEAAKSLKEILSQSDSYDLKLIPTLTGKRKTLKEIFNPGEVKNILVLIGPEGDFTPEEVTLAKKAGCIPITLGDLVLRVDTAAVAIASFIKLYENS